MIKEQGTIIATDAVNQVAWVAVQKHTACGACKARAGCGHGKLADLLQTANSPQVSTLHLPLNSNQYFTAGDTVEVAIPEQGLLLASVLGYLLPLLGLLSGLLTSAAFDASEPLIILSSFFGLFAGLLLARMISNRYMRRGTLAPQLSKSSSITNLS